MNLPWRTDIAWKPSGRFESARGFNNQYLRPVCAKWKWKLSSLGLVGLLMSASLSWGHGGGGAANGGAGQAGGRSRNNPYINPVGYSGNYHSSGYYDSTVYAYTPSTEQQTEAQKQVDLYFASLRKKKRRHAATHRYIAVRTLKPNKRQLEEYAKKRSQSSTPGSTASTKTADLECVMVFDTQSKQFVGSKCYIVDRLPPAGTVTKFETVSAEFVGQQTL